MTAPNLTLVQSITRLAVVTETWPPEINGVANTIGRLVHGIRDTGSYHVQLVRPRQQAREKAIRTGNFQEYLVNGLTLPFYREVRLGFPQYNALKRLWKQQRPDIVQIVTEGPLGYSAMKAAKKLGIPVISDFHTNFDQYSRYYRLSGFFNLAKRYLRHVHNQTLVTLVPTRELQQQLTACGYEKLGILERGIDAKLFNPQHRSAALRARLGIQPQQLLVTLVTRMAQEKNLDLAFEAFRAIQQQIPDARFLLVGDGPERKRLQDAHPDCLFAGMRTGTDLAEHYASGDLFLYPSTSETFGNVVMEAMASGLPVVTFDYAAAREHIRNGENGMAAPLDDNAAFITASLALAKDAELRKRMGAAATETAHNLSWERVIQRLHNTIQSVLYEVRHETATSA
ncbi:MAG: glycosyltransferase family 1 protein [Gammaproteobacteria bacterium]|nr:glycosyltransferase family 1 protein [Gammaproteobacteria bacterium]MBU2006059.1 glycosyltransferase family 1 protein [Gammaproteobacteria bacterium]